LIENLNTYSVSLKANQYWHLKLEAMATEGCYLAGINVVEPTDEGHDIICLIFDAENFRIWEHNQEALQRGAQSYQLPSPPHLASAKCVNAVLSFWPPNKGTYYLVLSNTHSKVTGKSVTLHLYWMWRDSGLAVRVRNTLRRLKWDNIWELYEGARNKLTGSTEEHTIQTRELIECCNDLRTAYCTLWINVCEVLTRQRIDLPPGKTPDIALLKDRSRQGGIPDYLTSLIAQIWSLASELGHAEKREGNAPPIEEVVYVHDLILVTSGYLLKLDRVKSKASQ
jgi:hypothetical protein